MCIWERKQALFISENKSFSYQDTPPLCSLLVCILNFDNKTSKFSRNVTIYLEDIWEKHILYINQGLQLDWKIRKSKCNWINVDHTYISMHIEIRLFILKILSKNAFWTWIKGHNYVVSEWNYPTCNSIPLLSDTNVYAMHMQNFCLFILKILTKNAFWHKSRAITLLFLNEIMPLAIPYHSSPIPMSMWSLKKIGKKVLKLEHRNEAQSIFDIHQGP